jgi:hypothetical protein
MHHVLRAIQPAGKNRVKSSRISGMVFIFESSGLDETSVVAQLLHLIVSPMREPGIAIAHIAINRK